MWFDEYLELISFDECAGLGVNNPADTDLACGKVITRWQRIQIQNAIATAERKIEEHLGYKLYPTFICDEAHYWGLYGYTGPLRWAYARGLGIKATAVIQSTVVLDYTGDPDPMEITVTTTVTDSCEVRVFHTSAKGGTEIHPSSVVIAGGVATIQIPRCRLIDPTLVQPENGFDYDLDSNFVTTVDVKRIYLDTTDPGHIEWDAKKVLARESLDILCTPLDCSPTLQDICGYVREIPRSLIKIWPSTDGVASSATISRKPDRVFINYLSNYKDACSDLCNDLPLAIEMAIVHMANAELPSPICGCSLHKEMWVEDSKWLDPELKAANPFGMKVGHYWAWTTVYNLSEALVGGLL